MLISSRRHAILEALAADRQVSATVLAGRFGCAVETVRRDLAELERDGQLRRVHGGAIALGLPELAPVLRRVERERRAKELAAAAAMALAPPGGLIFLGASSTTYRLALRLAELPVRTIFVTTMLDIAGLLDRPGRHEVHLAGGQIRHARQATGGPETLRYLARHRFDIAFIGVTAISARHGAMGPSAWHAELAEVLREQAARIVVVTDGSKFGREDRYRVLAVSCLHAIATDRPPPPPFPTLLADAQVKVLHG